MGWVRIDDSFPQHPKVAKAGPLGMAMQIAALCYCNRYLTDGFIPRAIIPNLLNLEGIGMRMWDGELFGSGEDATWQLIVKDLLNAGLWEEVEGGYKIHDYLDYQPSKAQVLAEREATAKRVSEYRTRQKKEEMGLGKNDDSNTGVTPLQPSYYGVSNKTPNPNNSTSLLRKDGDTTVSPQPLTEKQETPAKKEKHSRKETNPDVKVFLDYYRDTFLSRFGEPPVIEWGKDGAIVKRLLSTYGLERLKGLLGDFFNSQDVFVKEKGGYTIGVFKSVINKLISVKGQKPKPEGRVYYDLSEKLAALKQ